MSKVVIMGVEGEIKKVQSELVFIGTEGWGRGHHTIIMRKKETIMHE